MTRVNQARKAERLNYARRLLQRVDNLSDAVKQMARECSISPRQAYRYLEDAGRLKGPVSVGEEKIAFTVKLPRSLVQTHLCQSQALIAKRARQSSAAGSAGAEMTGWRSGLQRDATRFSWMLDEWFALQVASRHGL